MYGALRMARETDYRHGFGGARLSFDNFGGAFAPPVPPSLLIVTFLPLSVKKIFMLPSPSSLSMARNEFSN